MADLSAFAELVPLDHGLCVVNTLRGDGSVQSSVVNAGVLDHPVRAERVVGLVAMGGSRKLRNLRADPRVTLHVASKDFWTWVAVEGTAELTPVAADPHDATVEELVTYYRALRGEHEDWGAYRAAMVADRRLVVRFLPQHTYGQLRG